MASPSARRPSRPRKRPLDTASAAVEGAGDGLADGIEREGLQESLPRLAGEASGIAQRNSRSGRLRARLERADEKVDQVLEATKGKARALAESARRARTVPPVVARDVGRAAKAYAGGIGSSIGLYAAAGVVAIAAAIVLTVGLVQALERLWGEPWGALAVAALYGVVAAACVAGARGRVARGRREARERLQAARAELRHVAEPLRQAFRRDPTAPAAPAPATASPDAAIEPIART